MNDDIQDSGSEDPAFILVLLAFGLFGALYGVWLVLLADLQQAFGLSPGALGLALAAGLTASLPVMLVGGRLVDRWGAKVMLVAAAGVIALALTAVAATQHYGLLVGLLLLFFGATGAFDVAINAAAIQVEQRRQRKILAYFHATFSGCAALFALLGGVLVWLGVPFRLLYVMVALLALAFALITWRSTSLPRPQPSPGPTSRLARKRPGLYGAPAVLLLASITALAFLSEGEVGNWAGIYLRSSLELPPVLGAAGVAIFHAAMLVGRLGTAQAVRHFKRQRVLQGAGLMTAAGMLLALGTESAPVVLGGFLVTGLAVAVVAPITFSLVGDVAPERAGEASSVLTTVAYLGLLAGPVLVGGLAELVGLRLALGSIIVTGGLISLLSLWVLKDLPAGAARVVPQVS